MARAKGGPVSAEEEARIVAALKEGRSVRDVGAEVGRSKSTVANVARRNGLELVDVHQPKNAAKVHRYRAAEARLEFLARAIEKAEVLLSKCEEGREFQSIMTGAAIAIDKFKVEGGGDAEGAEALRAFFIALRGNEKNG